MKILVTGANGFAGRHLIAELLAHGHIPIAFDLTAADAGVFPPIVQTLRGDLTDAETLRRVLSECRPDACIHLAGLAFVPMGWSDPLRVFNINLMGVVNLLEAIRAESPLTRLLLITSAEIYGRELPTMPLTEDAPLAPDNPYALSKAAADQMALMYFQKHGLPILTARPCNHIGAGQSGDFVVPAFAAQLREMAAGRRPAAMRVGNLDSRRVFLDVRDVVRAYRLLAERGTPGRAYNIAGSQEVSIREVLDIMCRHAGVQPTLEVDPDLFRPTDRRPLLDAARMAHELNWRPLIPLPHTLRDIMA